MARGFDRPSLSQGLPEKYAVPCSNQLKTRALQCLPQTHIPEKHDKRGHQYCTEAPRGAQATAAKTRRQSGAQAAGAGGMNGEDHQVITGDAPYGGAKPRGTRTSAVLRTASRITKHTVESYSHAGSEHSRAKQSRMPHVQGHAHKRTAYAAGSCSYNKQKLVL